MNHVIVFFVDGIGLTDVPVAPWTTAHMPTFRALLGTPPTATLVVEQPGFVFKSLDTTLGVEGLPQSGTGHTTLWTGLNAPLLLGRHFPAYPAASQRALLAESGLFKQLVDAGRSVCVATVHRSQYWELVAQRQTKPTAVALAARAADVALPDAEAFFAGSAVPWDITGAYLARWGAWSPNQVISPQEAARRLLGLSQSFELVHYEYFLPDFVGHQRITESPEVVLELLDQMLAVLVAELPAHTTLMLVSDHGNLEEPAHRRHTINPVPFLVLGSGAATAFQVQDLSHVTPWILHTMSS